MKIQESLKDILEYYTTFDVIRRKKDVDKKQKKQEFRNILIINEGLTIENFNDKNIWVDYGYTKPSDYDDNETYYCICSHKITVLYFIQNVKSGNVYQVGCDCVEKNISKELAEALLKIRKEDEKEKKEKEEIIRQIEGSKYNEKMYKERIINFILNSPISKTYTINDVIYGKAEEWRDIYNTKSYYLKNGYFTNPEIYGFMKSHYSHPREYVNNLDIKTLGPIEQKNCRTCNRPLFQSKKYIDCKVMYCPNFKSCNTKPIFGYLIDPYIGPLDCNPLVYYDHRIQYLKNKI